LIGAVADFDDPAFMGDRWAAAYADLTFGPDPAPAVEFLAALADEGSRVLELGIGGGRVALPLARRGIAVEGIEASQAVLDRLRATPGAESIPVTLGDMADVAACFRNAARVLAPDGAFAIECFVPGPPLFDRGVEVSSVTEDSASMTLTRHDPVTQRIFTQRVRFGDGRKVRMFPVAMRYCWPSELDLMAELAGLRLRERYADFSRAPFGADSRTHVSVYEGADA
jgi:SAM-dependent methyltransferase